MVEIFRKQGIFDRFINDKFKMTSEDAYGHKGLQVFIELGEAMDESNDKEKQLEELVDALFFIMGLAYSPYGYIDINECERAVARQHTLHESRPYMMLYYGEGQSSQIMSFLIKSSKFFNRNDFSKYWKTNTQWHKRDCTMEWIDMYSSYLKVILSFGYTIKDVVEMYHKKSEINYDRQKQNY